jgi:hypothetical protein
LLHVYKQTEKSKNIIQNCSCDGFGEYIHRHTSPSQAAGEALLLVLVQGLGLEIQALPRTQNKQASGITLNQTPLGLLLELQTHFFVDETLFLADRRHHPTKIITIINPLPYIFTSFNQINRH